ncbi:DUF2007 domain-containing protein [Parashewanella curva]|uniref:DUF2007 domain-containing protein n=1 Tax=Parashewanella curva TaxID=2338552 RepID=A0A3L8PZ56_9GAMM|nr:DUF2007 domain-containing protein [Parashewanella curva]RLV59808.1 DUF2007 domain-containing protein [Parashewanella curva]
MSNMHLLCKDNSLAIHALKGLLQTQGIDAEVRGEALLGAMGELAADVALVELWVEAENLAKGKEVLESTQQQGSPWVCRDCGEPNEATFEICWQCGNEPF